MYGLHYREELDETVAKEFDSFLARLKSVFLLEHDEDGKHRFTFDDNDENLQALIDAAQQKGQWWKTGPWLWDDPLSGNAHKVNLRFTLANATYNDFAPTGIDTAVGLSIDPSGGNVVLNGIKALNDYAMPRTRILVIENIDGGSNTITLTHDASGSVADFRFDLPGGEDVVLDPGQNVWLKYDPDDARWRAFITGQASGSVISSGGGTSIVNYASLTLSDAQIKNGTGSHTLVAALAGHAHIPLRGYTRMTRSSTAFASGNLTGTVVYSGDANILLSSIDANFAGSGNIAHKHVVLPDAGYDGGWQTSTSINSPENKAVVLKLTGGPITYADTLGWDIVIAYVTVPTFGT